MQTITLTISVDSGMEEIISSIEEFLAARDISVSYKTAKANATHIVADREPRLFPENSLESSVLSSEELPAESIPSDVAHLGYSQEPILPETDDIAKLILPYIKDFTHQFDVKMHESDECILCVPDMMDHGDYVIISLDGISVKYPCAKIDGRCVINTCAVIPHSQNFSSIPIDLFIEKTPLGNEGCFIKVGSKFFNMVRTSNDSIPT